jgi:hypothetical protein
MKGIANVTSTMTIATTALLAVAMLAGCDGADDKTQPQTKPIGCGSAALHAATHDQCAPMDAKAVGEGDAHCLCMLGYAWNGSECTMLGDCACQGADCDKLTGTLEQCQAQHAGCKKEPEKIACGSAALHQGKHDVCAPMDVRAVGDDHGNPCDCLLGYAWNGSECTELADCACQGSDCDKLTETLEQCQAQHAVCSRPQRLSCGSSALYKKTHDQCDPMDATAVGNGDLACPCFLGFAWNGRQCVGLGNCSCVGADCNKLTQTIEECQAKHAGCGG